MEEGRSVRKEGKQGSLPTCPPTPGGSRSPGPLTLRLLGAAVCLPHWALEHRLHRRSQRWRTPRRCLPDRTPWACNCTGRESPPQSAPHPSSTQNQNTPAPMHTRSTPQGQAVTVTTCCHSRQPTKKEAQSKNPWVGMVAQETLQRQVP